MKRLLFSFSILILTFVWIYHTAATDYNPAINSIIGDISYVKKFGHLPSRDTDRNLRIFTHLAYVENLLRNDESAYNSETYNKRRDILDHLNNYRVSAEFHENDNVITDSDRCSSDKGKTTCTLCYLIEKSADKQTAEYIKKDLKNCRIAGVNSAALTSWIRESGLTREELEIIQPY